MSKTDPRMDWGFYAMTPRIVRTLYKKLSHTEKWLYTCLKDLCGKGGTCFRTLRSLKEETDISIASLSTMIPHLHESGLIHAEKKPSPRSGKEIWHISIIDIWQMNKDYCSKIEQSPDESVQILNEDMPVVHSTNNDVQKSNKEQGDCSNFERGCSKFSDIRIYPKNIDTEIYPEEDIGTLAGRESTPADSGSSFDSPTTASSQTRFAHTDTAERGTNPPLRNNTTLEETPAREPTEQAKKGKQAKSTEIETVVPLLDTGGQQIYDAWCSLFKSRVPLGPKTIEAANALYPLMLPWTKEYQSIAEVLGAQKSWMFKVDKKGFYVRGIRLTDLLRDFEAWQSAMERNGPVGTARQPDRNAQYSMDNLLLVSERRRARREAADRAAGREAI
jgi:predicted transcriptional regulator